MNKLIFLFYYFSSFVTFLITDVDAFSTAALSAVISRTRTTFASPFTSTLTSTKISTTPTVLYNTFFDYNDSLFDDDEDEDDDDEEIVNDESFFDVEAARKRLDNLFSADSDETNLVEDSAFNENSFKHEANIRSLEDVVDAASAEEEVFDVEAAREKLEGLMMEAGAGGGVEGTASDSFDIVASVISADTTAIAERKNDRRGDYIAKQELLLKGRSLSFLAPYLDPKTMRMARLAPSPPLTATDRQNRYAEINLLKQLVQSDAVLDDLYNFWFHEKGPNAGKMLEKADTLIGEGEKSLSSWSDAEEILLYLIDDFGVYWTEPINCLATLYYLQGRYIESEILYQWVLAVKPWHCGALSGIVRVYEAQRESSRAISWAPYRLPQFSSDGLNRRRLLWVHKALIRAGESLRLAQRRTDALFGKPDHHHHDNQNNRNSGIQSFDDGDDDVHRGRQNTRDDDAWQ